MHCWWLPAVHFVPIVSARYIIDDDRLRTIVLPIVVILTVIGVTTGVICITPVIVITLTIVIATIRGIIPVTCFSSAW